MRARKLITMAVVAVFFAATVVTVVWLRQQNARLRVEASALRQKVASVERAQEANRQMDVLLKQLARADGEASGALGAELEHARGEVAALEDRARKVRRAAKDAANVAALNRDPESGLTRLEWFRDVGRGTPSAAFQTLVWAAMTGENDVLVTALALDASARGKAEALRARLPEAGQKKYPTPESLAALVVTNEILRGGALQIVGHTMSDPQRATLRVRTQESAKTTEIPMQLGAGGWQFAVPERAIEALERRMRDLGEEMKPKG